MKRPPSRDAAGFAIGAKKHLGQNFLHERGVVEKIVLAIDPRPGDRIVEIGPARAH
jgi:16S rRNA (adenine1518-N6/adenine1519-N6)-dimethyltransferase